MCRVEDAAEIGGVPVEPAVAAAVVVAAPAVVAAPTSARAVIPIAVVVPVRRLRDMESFSMQCAFPVQTHVGPVDRVGRVDAG
jgi:hypothetical protein